MNMKSFACFGGVCVAVALLVSLGRSQVSTGQIPVKSQSVTLREKAGNKLLVEELPNGLQVVIERRTAVPVVRVMAYMRIGSIYENEYLGSGLSHYMEHIVHGGSTRRQVRGSDGQMHWVGRTEEESKKLLKSIGENTNASTFLNFTQYYITTKAEMAEQALDLISDWVQHCQFDAKEVTREQGVVQQELLRNLDNTGRFLNQVFNETMFKFHPLRVPVIGYQDCIQRLTREDMFRFYKKYYTPQNCVVSIVGDVDPQEMLTKVKRFFGPWKRKSLAPYVIPQEPTQTAMRWVEKEHGSTKTCMVRFGVPTIDLRDPDLYKLDMLSNVLGASASSRLPRKFEHDPSRKILPTGIYTSSWTPVFGGGRFSSGFSVDTVEHARVLVDQIWKEMLRLKTELVSQEEIDRAITVLEKQYHASRSTVDNRAEELASNLAWVADPLFNDGYLKKIKKVTPEDIREAARKYLNESKLNVVIITPPHKKAAISKTAESKGSSEVRKVVLGNGLTLLLKRVPDYGMVDVTAAFNGGVIFEDEKTNGLFFLMGNTFWRGTQKKPFPVLLGAMDQLGMSLSAESHNNVFFVKMQSLASTFDRSFDLFREVLREPAIDGAWVTRLKTILLRRVLPNLEVQARSISEKITRTHLYHKHPYRMQRFGTKETVSSFTVDDVRKLYQTFTRPNNCVLAIYGDIDLDKAEATARKAFGSWERGEIPASKVVSDPIPDKPQLVERTNKQVRTNYRIAWRAIPRQDEKRRYALSVMNSIIGAQGWLFSRLREGENKYVYAVSGSPYTGDGAGHYFIETDFRPKDEAAVVDIIDGVIDDIRKGRFSDDELELTKKMLLCYDALGKIKNAAVCSNNALSVLFGQGLDQDKKFNEGVKKVSRQDVIDIANYIFSRPALRIFIRPQ
jgi:zinc protease